MRLNNLFGDKIVISEAVKSLEERAMLLKKKEKFNRNIRVAGNRDEVNIVDYAAENLVPESDRKGASLEWILNMITNGDFIVGEDDARLKEALGDFTKFSRKPRWKELGLSNNLQSYKTIALIEKAVRVFNGLDSNEEIDSGEEKEYQLSGTSDKGVEINSSKVILNHGKYAVIQMNDYKELEALGGNSVLPGKTKWCTRDDYNNGNSYAKQYMESNDVMYMLLKNGRKHAQMHFGSPKAATIEEVIGSYGSASLMDLVDGSITANSDNSDAADLGKQSYDFNEIMEVVAKLKLTGPQIYNVAKNIINGRWKTKEKDLVESQNGSAIGKYAVEFMDERWEEVEDLISQDPAAAMNYAEKHRPGERWPEAEQNILKSPYHSFIYASRVINGRWKSAEEVIKASGHEMMADMYYPKILEIAGPGADGGVQITVEVYGEKKFTFNISNGHYAKMQELADPDLKKLNLDDDTISWDQLEYLKEFGNLIN